MHSGSSISPKHPAIPVSIGIASLVLEGRSSALDDSSIHASSHGSGGGGDGGGGGGTGAGGAGGSSNGGATDEDGGFCGKKRPSSSTTSSSSAGGPSGGGSASSSGASTLQECSLLAITEAHKLANATTTNCHMTDASQRINLKLQQIRSSCPGTSKDEVHHLVTVSGEPGSGRGRSTMDDGESPYGDMMYGVETFVNIASSWSHEAGPSASSSAVIYSGFEKMNVLGTVSPIKNHPIGNSFINFSSSSPNSSMAAAAAAAAAVASSASHSRKSTGSSSSIKQQQQQQQRPREGPHCEQFLKKIGLNKPDSSEGPEHCCSYRNKYCLRWQVYFKQLSTILTNGEAVCIEVYLGPENHTILLEQWILKLVMTKSPTTMTLQSLCAAIRSQLYFSQISAWTDLIKNSLEPEIFNHPRIKNVSPMMKGPSSAANATTTGKASFLSQQAKLDILFRIRTYDSTACFNEKPLVHNFPDASVADGFVIQVCLKSLPRLDRIPGIHAALDATKMIGATGTAGILSGDRLDRLPCHEKGKHRCAFREFELDDDEEGEADDPRMGEGDEGIPGMLLTSAAAISHREKQLLKYKKRMQKREKKKKSSGSSSSSSGSGGSLSTSSRSNTNGARHGSAADSSAYASPMSYSSCSNGSGSGTGGSISKSPAKGPYGIGGAIGNGGTTTVVYPNGTTNGSCTNGNCHNALTSSINSIQPPLYSSNQQQNGGTAMMVCCDDRYQTIAANSKSTQTSAAFPVVTDGAVSFVSSVATQTDGGGATTSANNYCADCCRSRVEEEKSVSSYSAGSINGPVKVVLGTGPVGSSSSSTNSDRHMQYFNDYYTSYDIINDNCDKRHPRPQTASAHHLRVVDAPMETSITTTGREGVAFPEKMVAENGTRPRPCFIVGGDGYEGDEDEGEGAGKASGVIMPNSGGDERPLQKGDLLLQAIQRTATLNSVGGRNKNGGSFATEVNHSQVMDDGGVLSEQKKSGGHALNNNNYVTANNNNIGEGSPKICSKGDREVGIPCDEGGKQKEPNGGNATEHWQHHQHQHEAGDGNGGSAVKCERSECDTFSKEKLDLGDCRLCKRQKTKHNFKLNLTNLLSSAVMKVTSGRDRGLVSVAPPKKPIITTVVDCGSTPPGCRRTLSESLVGHLTLPVGCSKGGAGAHGSMAGEEGACCGGNGREEANNDLYPIGSADISPGDSPMLSSSTGAVGNGGVFTFDQMKSYRRAFSEDVIDTITTSTSNGRSHIVQTSEDSTEEDDDTSGDNENEHELDLCERVPKRCGCNGRLSNGSSPLAMEPSAHTMAHHRAQTSTPAAPRSGAGKCKEPLYISCSETDCSVSTASSVSPHKKQILSCAAISGGGSGSRPLEANRTGGGGSTPNVQQLMQYKSSPKINLNYVFCLSPLARDDSGFTSGSSPATSTSYPATSPIAIDGSGAASGVTPVGNGGAAGCFGSSGSKGPRSQNGGSTSLFRYDFEESPISPISGTIKSKSAPAFPFSPPTTGALSPRFLRNAQQQRLHRTRYPSERSSVSERSSIGSDEQLSDDDLPYLLDSSNGYSPLSRHQLALMSGGSPLKLGQAAITRPSQMLSKVLNRNLFKFGRAPMLGTLEESLLQRRLSPKFQVADFKVLLGASGSFCPTQLTIPVASYFYELPGQHLTTPYVCELRLPRKGYSIPRTGTVQATLLNPLGTVVRMFVVPYDFRDMPAMSTTFIRQRILACDESSLKLLGKNIEQLSNAEQMKLLRYAIHLRFQTSRSGKLSLHTDIRLLISRRTDCDTAAAHAKNLLESPNELKVVTIVPENPKFSLRIDKQ
ncbi:protein Atossa [Anopheles ziemanni]|uniref:protein Atossa n=1 Tax=Anopheles ziemanni TaxID=345580 RepID=UPI00265E505A|nr:protein Atossa [Anopheles ziemanni]